MVTTKDILNLGYEHVGTALNGGSKLFKVGKLYVLLSNYDNNLISQNLKYEITIKKIDSKTLTQTVIYEGIPNTVDELKNIIDEKCI